MVRNIAPNSALSPRATAIDDVDGDGVRDVVLGELLPNAQRGLRVYSGATGALLQSSFLPADASPAFGAGMVLPAGDRDGDGFGDYFAGDNFALGTGVVYLMSGATGTEISRFVGASFGDFFGADIDLIEDMDGDQLPELVVAAPNFSGLGRVEIISSQGVSLVTITGNTQGEFFGVRVAAVDDFDLDGMEDIAVAVEGTTGPSSVKVFSTSSQLFVIDVPLPTLARLQDVSRIQSVGGGPGGNVLVSYADAHSATSFVQVWDSNGNAIRSIAEQTALSPHPVGDMNGDGLDELAVLGGIEGAGVRGLVIYSGLDFCPLLRLQDFVPNSFDFVSASPIGDTNGDGLDEIILGRSQEDTLIVTTAGRGLYGSGTTLALDWVPGTTGALFINGDFSLSGGTPGGTATLVASLASADVFVGLFQLLVDLSPGQSVALTVPLDPTGAAVLPGPLAGNVELSLPLFLQAFELAGGTFESSNGLEVMVTRRVASPVIESLSPGFVPAGQQFQAETVQGACLRPGITVRLNGVTMPVVQFSDRLLQINSNFPVGAPPQLDSVLEFTNPGGLTVSVPYNPSPVVDSVVSTPVPPTTTGGEEVTIRGEHFFPGTVVTIGGVAVPLTISASDFLSFTSPPLPAGPAQIVVLSPNGGQATSTLTVTAAMPSISSVVPNAAVAGDLVILQGAGFDSAATLTVGGLSISPIGFDPILDRFFYIQPAGLGCDEALVITNPGGASASAIVNATPTSTSHTSSGPSGGGNLVFVNGPIDILSGVSVTLAGVAVSIAVNPNGITFVAPPQPPGAVNLVITNAVGCVLTLPYTYL